MKKILIPTNTDKDGVALTLKSNYKGMSGANFKPQIGGGYREPMIMEIIYEDRSDNMP